MPQELLFELNGARVTPHIATFGGTSYQISNIGSVRVTQRKKYNPLAVKRTSSAEVDAIVSRNKEFVSNVQKAVEQAFVVRARQPPVSSRP